MATEWFKTFWREGISVGNLADAFGWHEWHDFVRTISGSEDAIEEVRNLNSFEDKRFWGAKLVVDPKLPTHLLVLRGGKTSVQLKIVCRDDIAPAPMYAQFDTSCAGKLHA